MKKKVTAPLSYDPGKGRPKEHLAYLNWQEMQQLQRLNGGNMERGPRGLPSFPPADAKGSSSKASSSSTPSGGGGRDTGAKGNVGMGKASPSSGSKNYGGGARDSGSKGNVGTGKAPEKSTSRNYSDQIQKLGQKYDLPHFTPERYRAAKNMLSQAEPMGSINPYSPSYREQIADYLNRSLYGDNLEGAQRIGKIFNAADALSLAAPSIPLGKVLSPVANYVAKPAYSFVKGLSSPKTTAYGEQAIKDMAAARARIRDALYPNGVEPPPFMTSAEVQKTLDKARVPTAIAKIEQKPTFGMKTYDKIEDAIDTVTESLNLGTGDMARAKFAAGYGAAQEAAKYGLGKLSDYASGNYGDSEKGDYGGMRRGGVVGLKNKKQKITAPLSYDPGKGRPKEHLAYLNQKEMRELQRLNGGNMELGPRGLPSFPPADAIGSSSRASSSGSYGGGGRDTGGRGNVGMGKAPSSPRGDVGGRGGPGGGVLSSPVRSIPSVAGRGVDSRGRSVSEVAASIRKDVNTRIAAAKLAEERSNKDVAAKRAAEAANARSLRGIPAVKDDIRKAAEGPAFGSRFGTQIQGTISGLAARPSSVRVGPAAYSPALQGVYGPRAAYDPSRIGQYASPQKQFTEKVPRYIDKVPFSAREPEAFKRTPTGLGNVMSRGPLGYARGLQAEAQWQAGFNPPVRSEIPSKSADVKKDISRAIGSAYGAPPRPTGPLAQRPTTPAREDRPFTEIAPPPAPPAERTKMFYDRIEPEQSYNRILERAQGQPYRYGSISAPATGAPQVDQPRLNITGGMGFLPIQSSLPSAPSRRISTSATLEQKNRLYGSAPIKLSDDTGDLGKTRGLSPEDAPVESEFMSEDEVREAAKKAGFRPSVYENEEFLSDPNRLGMMAEPPSKISPTDMAKIVSRAYGEKYLTRSEKDRLAASKVIQGVMRLNPLARLAVFGAEKIIKPEDVKTFLSRPSYEQEELYRLGREMDARYGRREPQQIADSSQYPSGPGPQYGGPDLGRGDRGEGIGSLPIRGGAPSAGPGIMPPSSSTDGSRPYIYYQWDVGVNIPSPGDPDYTMYQEYLRRRAQAQA